MAYYRCGPTAIGNRTSWGPVSSPTVEPKSFDRPLSGNYDRIFNAFERTNAFEYVKSTFEGGQLSEERLVGHGEVVVNRKMSSSFERADCALAAHAPLSEDEDFYREKILYSQARQLYPLQEDLADWINKTIGISYLSGENFLDVLDNGVELCQLAAVIHDRAQEAVDQGLAEGPIPQIRGRCWQRAARRSFFSRDNTENFITFCRDLGVHDNLLFESDDLVLHNQPRQVILCLLELARLASRFGVEPPGLVQLEKEIALEERDSGVEELPSAWRLCDVTQVDKSTEPPPSTPEPDEGLGAADNTDNADNADNSDAASTRSDAASSSDGDVPLQPTNELDKRVQLVSRLMARGCACGAGGCRRLLTVKKLGEGRYHIAGRNVFIRLLKGRHMMVRVGGGWDTLEHFLSRHEPCQVRLVTRGRKELLPVPTAVPTRAPSDTASEHSDHAELSAAESFNSLKSKSRTVSPIDSKASSLSGKISPIGSNKQSRSVTPIDKKPNGKISPVSRKTSGNLPPDKSSLSGKTSPVDKMKPVKTSTPYKPSRSSLSLQLQPEPRPARKLSAPTIKPRTPTNESRKSLTPTNEPRNSLTPTNDRRKSITPTTPKKSRSMSLATTPIDRKFCGTDRLNQQKSRSVSAASTPTTPLKVARSQSLASTPVEPKKTFANGYAKKTRSMSLAAPVEYVKPLHKSVSLSASGALTQAAIEESIRLSLTASIADDHSTKRPFLHIKAKYRSPPPREVPPR